jgi:hypothetical protein
LGINSGIVLYGVDKGIQKEIQIWRSFPLVFKGSKTHIGKFIRKWFGPYIVQFYLPNNIIFLVIMDKFDPNHILTNINKLKPYKFLDDETKTIDGPQVVYWEGQGDVDVNDKKKQQ